MRVCVCCSVVSTKSLLTLICHDANIRFTFSDSAIRFSYWMANNAPFSIEERLELLKMHSVLERLLFIWEAVKRLTRNNGRSFVCCNRCDTQFTTVSDVFTVGGADGNTATYVNGQGYIHQITTLRNVDTQKIVFQGYPSTENRYDMLYANTYEFAFTAVN